MADALISDPEVQENYQARAPEAPATSSAHTIKSGLDRGKAFSEADGSATDRMVAFLKGAQRGLLDANGEANKSGGVYRDGDRKSEADVKSVAVPVLCLVPPDAPDVAAPGAPSIVTTTKTPVLGGI